LPALQRAPEHRRIINGARQYQRALNCRQNFFCQLCCHIRAFATAFQCALQGLAPVDKIIAHLIDKAVTHADQSEYADQADFAS